LRFFLPLDSLVFTCIVIYLLIYTKCALCVKYILFLDLKRRGWLFCKWKFCFSLPHLVSHVSHAFGVSGFLVCVVSVLLRSVCAGAFFVVRRLVFLCEIFVSESACGSVFRILRVFSGVV
jgi:hypothetical protein